MYIHHCKNFILLDLMFDHETIQILPTLRDIPDKVVPPTQISSNSIRIFVGFHLSPPAETTTLQTAMLVQIS